MSPRAVGVGLFAIILLTYSAVVVTEYAVTDDYFVLAKAKKGDTLRHDAVALAAAKKGEPSLVASLARGCVTSALLQSVVFEKAHDIANLRYARLAGLLGLGLLAYFLYRALTYVGWPPGRSAALAILMCT